MTIEDYMRICIQLGKQALKKGNPPVGAILVYNGKVIGQGIEAGKSTGDITNHAEIEAIRNAINNGFRSILDQSSMFTTHEPCIMCAYNIRHHKLKHLYYGTPVDDIGGHTSSFKLLTTTSVPKWGTPPHIHPGIMMENTHELQNEYFSLMTNS